MGIPSSQSNAPRMAISTNSEIPVSRLEVLTGQKLTKFRGFHPLVKSKETAGCKRPAVYSGKGILL